MGVLYKNGSAHVSGAMLESARRGLRHEADVSTRRSSTAFNMRRESNRHSKSTA